MVDVVRPHPRQLRALAAGAVAVLAVAACTSGGKAKPGQPAFPDTALSWARGRAEAANGPAPTFTVQSACGSATDTYLAELLHTSPTEAKVLHEWGDIVAGGKQVLVSGKVTHTHLGPFDLPMSHPYGYDLSLDIALDPPFLPFSKNLGPVEVPDVEMHTEVASGLIPHAPGASDVAAGATWAQRSDATLGGIQPGFEGPAVGDRIVTMGRWVIDCGHDNFQTELHPMSFVAWAHTEAATTTVHLFANPYRDTETYSPDASILGQVGDATRFKRPDAKPFPTYLVSQVLGLVTGGGDRVHAQELIEAARTAPAPFAVCVPGAHDVQVAYDLVTRPGVDVKVTHEQDAACATVAVGIGRDYRPLDAALRQCPLPWSYLNDVAAQALGGNVDIRNLLLANVPPFVRDRISADPDTTCADPLAGPPVDAAPAAPRSRADDGQPFPVYGVIRVTGR